MFLSAWLVAGIQPARKRYFSRSSPRRVTECTGAIRASAILAERALKHPKITPIWDTVLTEYRPDDQGEMRAVRLQNLVTKEEWILEVRCVFMAIGHTPNTAAFQEKLPTDKNGSFAAPIERRRV